MLADMPDNPGGGAPSDATFLLREILARGITSVATGLYWDPVAVRSCREAGISATLPLRLEESLRQVSSVIAWRRIALEDTTIGDTPVPKGAKLLSSLAGANRDPDIFPEPDAFNPGRDNARATSPSARVFTFASAHIWHAWRSASC